LQVEVRVMPWDRKDCHPYYTGFEYEPKSALSACPFCLHENLEMSATEWMFEDGPSVAAMVTCGNCLAMISGYTRKDLNAALDSAVDFWNRREYWRKESMP